MKDFILYEVLIKSEICYIISKTEMAAIQSWVYVKVSKCDYDTSLRIMEQYYRHRERSLEYARERQGVKNPKPSMQRPDIEILCQVTEAHTEAVNYLICRIDNTGYLKLKDILQQHFSQLAKMRESQRARRGVSNRAPRATTPYPEIEVLDPEAVQRLGLSS